MLKRIADFISGHMALIVLAAALSALFLPGAFSWINPKWISPMLGIIMCGMGMNLSINDFKVVFSRPKDILAGVAAQFTVMPLLAWILTLVFRLPQELAIGVILLGCCPGGTASNVITYLAKGDLPLSVGMTAVSTLLAPILTPMLTFLLAGQSVDVNIWGMLLSIVQVVILPIAAGIVIKRFFGKISDAVTPYLPMISTIAIVAIIACVVSSNASRILSSSLVVLVVILLHNTGGYALGFLIAKALGMSKAKRAAVSVEVGMQNSALAVSLATVHFPMYPMAAIPGALFSVWHNFSGALLASLFRNKIQVNPD